METIIDTFKKTVINWWIHLLLGILFIIMAIWMILTPSESFIALSLLFSIFMFISGLSELLFALSNSNRYKGWGWSLGLAIVDFTIGLALLSYPEISQTILPFFLAFWILFKSFSAIGKAIEFRRYRIKSWWVMLVLGILGVVLTFMIIKSPVIGSYGIVLLIAISFFNIGIFKLILSIGLRRLNKYLIRKGS